MIVSNQTNGYYVVNGNIITNKLQAIIEATKSQTNFQWVFFDDVFINAITKLDVSLQVFPPNSLARFPIP